MPGCVCSKHWHCIFNESPEQRKHRQYGDAGWARRFLDFTFPNKQIPPKKTAAAAMGPPWGTPARTLRGQLIYNQQQFQNAIPNCGVWVGTRCPSIQAQTGRHAETVHTMPGERHATHAKTQNGAHNDTKLICASLTFCVPKGSFTALIPILTPNPDLIVPVS